MLKLASRITFLMVWLLSILVLTVACSSISSVHEQEIDHMLPNETPDSAEQEQREELDSITEAGNGATLAELNPLPFSQLYMQDQLFGYAIGFDEANHFLYKTENGGQDWKIIEVDSFSGYPVKIEGDSIWLIRQEELERKLLISWDRGDSWAEAPLLESESAPIIGIDFIDEQQGVLTGSIRQIGQQGDEIEIWRTNDGAKSWQVILGIDDQEKLPIDSYKSGAVLSSATDVWVGGGGYGHPIIYFSQDGGASWTHFEVEISSLASADIISFVYPPIFFSETYGVFPFEIHIPEGGTHIVSIVTKDGGESWEVRSSGVFPSSTASHDFVYNFIENYAWISLDRKTMYGSSDFQEWYPLVDVEEMTSVRGAQIETLNLVSEKDGFMLIYVPDEEDELVTFLYQTVDGGKSWRPISASF